MDNKKELEKNSNGLAVLLFSGIILISVSLFLYASYFLFQNGMLHAFDTGIYLQLFENIKNYGDLASSITSEKNFLAHHFQPIILFVYVLYRVVPHPSLLFAVNAGAILISMLLLFRSYKNRVNILLLGAGLLGILWHPSTSSRIYYCFVPETLALPFLTLQALYLSEKNCLNKRDLLLFTIYQIIAGLCKENIWVVNSFVALLCAFKYKNTRIFFTLLSASQLFIFALLFFWWMPKNTSMPSYYGLGYYQNPMIQGSDIISRIGAMVLNILSLRTIETFFLNTVFLTGIFPIFQAKRVLLGALPGFLFIVGSNHTMVHDPLNQYPLLYLPFVWVCLFHTLSEQKNFNRFPNLKKYIPIVLILPALTLVVPQIYFIYKMQAKSQFTPYIPSALNEIKEKIGDSSKAVVLMDGNFQTHFSHFRNTYLVLEFKGNPHKKSAALLDSVTDVVTQFDPRVLKSCNEIKQNNENLDSLEYDYQAFYDYCEWLRREHFQVTFYPNARVYHFQKLTTPPS